MFNYLNSILYKSTKNPVDLTTLREETNFQPYLLQRWCSMHSTSVAIIVNETTNRYWSVLNDNSMWYISLNTVLPRCSFKKINYFKKVKNETVTKERETIQKVANSLEISSRELITYIETFNIKINSPKNND